MKTTVFDHRSGLRVVSSVQLAEVKKILGEITPRVRKNTVTEIRDAIASGLMINGWSGEYRLDITSKISITSYQNEIGLCLQTGNVSRIYADMMKLQALYLKGKIKAGLIIVPQKELAVKLGSNIASYERIICELPIFTQVISMPLVVIGFNVEEE